MENVIKLEQAMQILFMRTYTCVSVYAHISEYDKLKKNAYCKRFVRMSAYVEKPHKREISGLHKI